MKALVMGGGIIGVSAAWFLARDGHEVTVIDRQPEPACETSYANAGLVAPGHAFAWGSPNAPVILVKSLFREDQALRLRLRADPRMWAWMLLFLRQCTSERARVNTIAKLRLCLYSLEQLHQVVRETGVAYDGRGGGNLYVHRTEAGFRTGVEHSRILRENGLSLEIADPERTAELEPAFVPVKDKIAGAIYSPTDESGDAHMFARNLAAYCAGHMGVRFLFDTTIRRIEARDDRVRTVVTDRGNCDADVYVLALGCDSAGLARPLRLRLPIYPVKGYSVTLPVAGRNLAPGLGGVDEDHLVAWARMGERLRITSTAELAGYDRSHRAEDFKTMLKVARELFPEGADYERPEYWAGLRPMTPSTVPVLGPTPYRNLVLDTGHGHIGWTMSCGSGRIIADLVAGREPEISLEGMTYGA